MPNDDGFMDIRQAMIEFLLSPPCQTISFRVGFSYGTCIVNANQFSMLAEHLRARRIHIEGRYDWGHMDAAYSPSSNTILVPGGFMVLSAGRREDEPVCVHEMTHALFDQQHFGTRPALDSEIVAFIAETIYRIRTGNLTAEPIIRASRAIVLNYINSGRNLVSGEVVEQLRNVFLNSTTYSSMRDDTIENDGIF